MPHFKCVPCKTRLHRPAGQADRVGDLCPDCGSLLEPVGELSEVIGFRSINPGHGAAEAEAPDMHQRIAGPVDDLIERRAARAQLDDDCWLDDDGHFSPEAVAEALALPTPNSTGEPR